MANATAQAGGLRYYWMTGCSSCQRTKEFLLRHHVAFESINLAETPERMPEVLARGFRGVPVLMDDDRAILAQDLNDVADFVGIELQHAMLAPAQIAERLDAILASAVASTRALPNARLRESLDGRDRPHSHLVHHIYRVIEAFIEQAEGRPGSAPMGTLAVFPADDASNDELAEYGESVRRRFATWWRGEHDSDFARPVATYDGDKPLHRVFERATWHAAHHTRQLERLVLPAVGATPPQPLRAEILAGLPLPNTIF